MNLVANNDVAGFVIEFFDDALDLIQTVRLMVHRHQERDAGFEQSQHGGEVNRFEVSEEHVRGRRAAIHDHDIRSLQSAKHFVEQSRLAEIQKAGVRMKSLQRGVLIVRVTGGERDSFVLQELDEIYREETFSDAA